LHDAVRAALTESLGSPIVMCHVSHAYETGASLYFTVLAARDAVDPAGQWARAKKAASEAITGLGTISHHHSVGIDHAPYLGAEIGEIGLDVLRAAKNAVDPTGILNPGKLIAG
jgi:alkyldihydroxyacetonephosphate synthase